MNVTYDQPGREHLLIGGNQPRAEFTPAAMLHCETWQRTAAPRAEAEKNAARPVLTPRGPVTTLIL